MELFNERTKVLRFLSDRCVYYYYGNVTYWCLFSRQDRVERELTDRIKDIIFQDTPYQIHHKTEYYSITDFINTIRNGTIQYL